MEDGRIEDSHLTASSSKSDDHEPHNARLNHQATRPLGSGRRGAWRAADNDHKSPWIQVNLGATKNVSGVVLQGREDSDQWVTKYKVMFGYEDAPLLLYNVTPANPKMTVKILF